jgi:SAM-dependent methyltransferase
MPIVAWIVYFLVRDRQRRGERVRSPALGRGIFFLALALVEASLNSGSYEPAPGLSGEQFWSPYYRVSYDCPPVRHVTVNLIGHQTMVSRADDRRPSFAYALPQLLNRDAGGKAFRDVLIIGAGSGNDVSRALAWKDVKRIDAVEIDPVIQRLGARDHPGQPYQDPRVTAHLDDGRNFLQSGDAQYDLIVYALVDSLVLHSGYSNIGLESYLFTSEAFADVRRRLRPDGLFVVYNYLRHGWIVGRLADLDQRPGRALARVEGSPGDEPVLASDQQRRREPVPAHELAGMLRTRRPQVATVEEQRPAIVDRHPERVGVLQHLDVSANTLSSWRPAGSS